MLRRALWLLIAVSLGATLLCTLGFVAGTLGVRLPYWGEAEVIYEAARLREHQPLFIDALAGTTDVPPSHYYVTYPPLFSVVLALVPSGAALVVGRVVSTLAWFGTLGAIAWRSKKREPILAAAFIAGSWVITNFAMLGRPDSLAAALAAIALLRATRRDRLDVLTIALFVLVPWVKPTFLGLPVGALVAHRDRRGMLIAAGFAVVSALAAYFLTSGEIFAHVVRSNAQPFTLQSWLDQVPGRLPFFAPLFAWAAWLGRQAKQRVGLGALLGATLWTLLALAKTGSSSNYWMEPCIAALVVVARSGAAEWTTNRLVLALVAVLWTDVAAIRGALEHTTAYRSDAAAVEKVRAMCPTGTIMADEAGIELVLDGRIVVPTYQFVWLVKRGQFPAEPWIHDLNAASCYVEHTHQLSLAPELAAARAARFRVATEASGITTWSRR